MSRSIASPTISSAVKNDHRQPEIKEKLRELAVDRDINYVTHDSKTKGRPPFVVRHVRAVDLVFYLRKNYFIGS